ncbi:hypothetical protein CEXT_509801 [Caerostris extrusa]|uniref:Ribonuclease P/MRP protein subunit POP5 n=1 Tax=Caerostris extrusa TaxID=172846 RepID=A0AAV4NE98_CAEEX|nr:hypothetical protein CEXT_509801 [Caerostris extrusa]
MSIHDRKSVLPIRENELRRTIIENVVELHGEFGMGCILASFAIKMFNPHTRTFIARVHRRACNILSTTLAMITKVGNMRVAIINLHLSGTISSASKYLNEYNRQKLNELIKRHDISAETAKEISDEMEKSYERLNKRLKK